MAEVSNPSNKFKSIILNLQKSVECPICLETVKIPFKSCVKGHPVCKVCTTRLDKCPLCQEKLTLENLICLKNVLEALPRLCCYSEDGCEDVVEQGGDHEEFCGYRPIVCVECDEKITLIKFVNHYKEHNIYINDCCLPIDKESIDITWQLICDEHMEEVYVTPVFLFDNLFWIIQMVDRENNLYKIDFQATPIGKLEHDYYARITLERGNFTFACTLKAGTQALSSCFDRQKGYDETNCVDEQLCMRIPLSEISRLKIDDSTVNIKFLFFREDKN